MARIENKAIEIKAACSVKIATTLAELYVQDLVDQRKELSKEKERLQEERRELQRNLGGGHILCNLIFLAL
jgi:hypothetical protein